MKSILTSAIIVSSLTYLVSCSKKELIKEPQGALSQEQIARATQLSPKTQESQIRGIYTTMYTTGTGGIGGHDDFGQKGNDIFSDLLCGDMALGGSSYGWYVGISNLTNMLNYQSNAHYQVWRYYYRIVYAANAIIDALGGNDAQGLSEEAQRYMGQAKAMRAYAYFYLAQFLIADYDPAARILPLYTSVSQINLPRSTTKEVYDLIVSDLRESVAYLDGYQRSDKSAMNKYVAEMLLAYAYAAQGLYAEAATAAKDVIDNGGFTMLDAAEVTNGFNDVNTPSWMWGVDLTTQIGLDLVSWWGQTDVYTYSYAAVGVTKDINQELFEAIGADDARKNQFVYYNTVSRTVSTSPVAGSRIVAAEKFYPDTGKTVAGQRIVTSDYVYMRVEEAYLLYAESLAMSGNAAGAKDELKRFMSKRLTNPDEKTKNDIISTYNTKVDAMSDQELKDEIYLQTRIEFFGEGKSYLAMKRNKAQVTYSSRHLFFPGQSYQYNDPRLTFSVPQQEILNNPNINQ